MYPTVLFFLMTVLSAVSSNAAPGYTALINSNSYVDKAVKNFPQPAGADKKVFHLVSHGRPGELLLNGQWRNAQQIAEWLPALTNSRLPLYVYGCEFGKGEKGRAAVAYLEKKLGVPVSASDDITGIDGDWDLETGVFASIKGLENYTSNLQACSPDYGTYISAMEYANTSSGGYSGSTNGAGSPNGAGISVYYNAAPGSTYQGIFTYLNGFSGGDTLIITARYNDNRHDGVTLEFSEDGVTYTSPSSTINGFPTDNTTYGNVKYTLPASLTGQYKYIRVRGVTTNSYLNIDAIEALVLDCNTCNINIAPMLSNSTIANTCPANTFNLNSITASNTPAGAELTWHTGTPATNSNRITNLSNASGFRFYAAFHSIANNCYSGINGNATTVVNTTGDIDCDGVPNSTDLDDDNDGIPDNVENECGSSLSNFNAIVNGDFTNGTSGFYTELDMYDATIGAAYASYNGVNGYTATWNPYPANGTRPTDPTNNYISTNDIADPGVSGISPIVVWRQTVTLPPNSTFIWRMDMTTSGVMLDFQLNGISLVTGPKAYNSSNGYSNGTWRKTDIPFNSGSGTITLQILQYATGSAGAGDMGIDNIEIDSYCHYEIDTDTDGIPDYLDLDSDNDGCPDLKEAGVSPSTDVITPSSSLAGSFGIAPGAMAGSQLNPAAADANNDGINDSVDPDGNGQTNYPSTYNQYALSSFLNTCNDLDGDGINDIADIDDDNDGIVDAVESPACYYTEAEATVITSVTSELTQYSTYVITNSYDGNSSTQSAFATGQNWVGKTVFEITPATPLAISSINFDLGSWYLSNGAASTFQLEGWDGVNWVALSAAMANTNTTDFSISNTLHAGTTYSKYRIAGVAGTCYYSGVNEITLTAYQFIPSAHPKAACSNDTDGDGVPNHQDLDSDGDGCPDLKEAGVSPLTDISTPSSVTNNIGTSYGIAADKLTGSQLNPAATDANNDGLNDSVDPGKDGQTDYTSTYNYAISATENYCLDSDGDGIIDLFDIDDDNDGIPDSVEMAEVCNVETVTPSSVTVTPSASFGLISNTIDNSGMTGSGLAATTVGPVTTSTAWYGPDNVTTATIDYVTPAGSSASYILLWATESNDATTGGDGPIKDFTITITYNNGANTYTTGKFTTVQPTGVGTPNYAQQFNFGQAFTNVTKITLNVLNGWYDSDSPAKNDGWVSTSDGPISSQFNLTLAEFRFGCYVLTDIDTDGDGIPNRLDLDSDGDGCSDLKESGVSPLTDVITPSATNNAGTSYGISIADIGNSQLNPAGTDTNNDGLNDSVDPDLNGQTNYVSTYAVYALVKSWNFCNDKDGDGILDLDDIDDDNDGILDAVESPACFYTSAEITIPSSVSTQIPTTGTIANVYDNNTATTFAFTSTTAANAQNKTIFEITPVSPVQASAIVINYSAATGNALGTAANSVKIEGWNGASWVSLATLTPAAASANMQTLAIPAGSQALYQKYRLYDVNAAISTAVIREVTLSVPASYVASAHPKVTCNNDTDGDGIPNHQDLDSDGDGCGDAVETGITGTLLPSVMVNNSGVVYSPQAVAQGPYGLNGFANALETSASPESGVYSGSYTDYNNAINSAIHNCAVAPQAKPDVNITYVNTQVSGNLAINDVVAAGSTYGSVTTVPGYTNPGTETPVVNSDGTYTFTAATTGIYQFYVSVCPPSVSTGCQQVLLTIEVLNSYVQTNKPVANPDFATIKMNGTVTLKTLTNDHSGNNFTTLQASTVTITAGPKNGKATVNTTTGDITYTAATGFTGQDTLTYSVCDDASPTPNCNTSYQIITVLPSSAFNSVTASDDYLFVPQGATGSGNALTNDYDPDGNTMTVVAQNVTIPGKGTFILQSNGSYTFQAESNFTGAINFPYKVNDNGSPTASAWATIYILVPTVGSLPLDLLTFTAIKERGNTVGLNWTTANEINSSHFVIERMVNGTGQWEAIGIVHATGNGNTSVNSYYFQDRSPLNGANYYRLKQVDLDGSFKYSPVRLVNFDGTGRISVYPNPADDHVIIKSTALLPGTIHIYDALGQQLDGMVRVEQVSSQQLKVQLSRLTPGMYIIKVNGHVVKLVKK